MNPLTPLSSAGLAAAAYDLIENTRVDEVIKSNPYTKTLGSEFNIATGKILEAWIQL